MLTIKTDFKEVESLFKDLGNKLPKVMADTINVLGGRIKEETIKEMRSKFKGGTSNWVLNSFSIKKASPSNLKAEVYYNRGRNFMEAQVDGGVRKSKAAESLLRAKGILAAGEAYLPTDPMADGNMSPGTRSRVLSYFKTYTGTNARNNRQGASLRSGVSFFALQKQVGKLHPGVYQRVDDARSTALRAQRAMIAKQLINQQGRGFGFAKNSAAGKQHRQSLLKQLKAVNQALLPRGIKMVMAFDRIKAYRPLIKFYEIGDRIVANELGSTFRSVAKKEMGW